MASYGTALTAGLEAAKKVERARKEIDAVFKDLNEEIWKSTDRQIKILRDKEYEPSGLLDMAYISLGTSPIRKFSWIVAAKNVHASNQAGRKLADWNQSDNGYPCSLKWKQTDRVCNNKRALEATLEDLLKDSATGETIMELLNLQTAKTKKDKQL